MPDAFFASTKTRKRKRTNSQPSSYRGSKKSSGSTRPKPNGKTPPTSKRKALDEELESDRTDEEQGGDIDDLELERRASEDELVSGDEDEDETPAQKRLRLAQLYLDNVKEGLADGEFDAKDVDRDLISSRLKQDVLEHAGKVHLFIADNYDFTTLPSTVLRTKGHRFSVTSAVASESGQHLFTSGKEGHIIKWDLQTGKKLTTFYKQLPAKDRKGKGKAKAKDHGPVQGHTDEVLALAISGDGKILVSGGRDRRLVVWDVEKDCWEKCFYGPLAHKDAVSSVSFKKGTRQLYSASNDRTIKVYDLSPTVMGYVETLFGHQDFVLSIDSLRGDTCVSVGGRDKTVRYWKIVDETQLVFRGGGRSKIREVLEGGLGAVDEADEREETAKTTTKKFVEGSLECVAMIDETTFLSGGDTGSICLWSTQKKKAVFTQALAHGLGEMYSETEGLIQLPRWITALGTLRYSDVFASGSYEGSIRIWKLSSALGSFSLIGSIPAPGVINSLQLFLPPSTFSSTAQWMTAKPRTANGADASSEEDAPLPSKGRNQAKTVVLVAGMGQEHRYGRWIKTKEDGAVNGTMVVGFTPRTLSSL